MPSGATASGDRQVAVLSSRCAANTMYSLIVLPKDFTLIGDLGRGA